MKGKRYAADEPLAWSETAGAWVLDSSAACAGTHEGGYATLDEQAAAEGWEQEAARWAAEFRAAWAPGGKAWRE